jgi:hypothetical protein
LESAENRIDSSDRGHLKQPFPKNRTDDGISIDFKALPMDAAASIRLTTNQIRTLPIQVQPHLLKSPSKEKQKRKTIPTPEVTP